MRPKSKLGFTLLELLVVIAIIGLLSAILLPVFGQARERARRSSCLSNLRNIGTALQLYVDDYDSFFPLREYSITAAQDPVYDYQLVWAKRIRGSSPAQWNQDESIFRPYLGNTQVFGCPSAKDLDVRQPYEKGPFGYGYNQSYIFPSANPKVNGSIIEKPAETFFIGDTGYFNTSTLKVQTFTGNWAPSVGYPTSHGRHQGFANVCWADGHAKAVKITLRTSGTAVEDWARNQLGDLIHPDYPKGSANENYYYMLDKPDA